MLTWFKLHLELSDTDNLDTNTSNLQQHFQEASSKVFIKSLLVQQLWMPFDSQKTRKGCIAAAVRELLSQIRITLQL